MGHDGWTYRPNTIKRSERQAELDKYVRVYSNIEVTKIRPLSYVVMKVTSNIPFHHHDIIITSMLAIQPIVLLPNNIFLCLHLY